MDHNQSPRELAASGGVGAAGVGGGDAAGAAGVGGGDAAGGPGGQSRWRQYNTDEKKESLRTKRTRPDHNKFDKLRHQCHLEFEAGEYSELGPKPGRKMGQQIVPDTEAIAYSVGDGEWVRVSTVKKIKSRHVGHPHMVAAKKQNGDCLVVPITHIRAHGDVVQEGGEQ